MLINHSLLPRILIICVLCTLIVCKNSESKDNKVLLTEVKVLTVFHDKFTTGRRSPSLPQLMCVGGDACDYFQPESMQCKNMGNDGYTVQWKCDAEMEDYFRLGQVTVNCEGYKNREDKYILRGSCGVEYSLYLTEKGKRWKSPTKGKDPFQRQYNYKNQHKSYINTDYDIPHWGYVFILVPALWYIYTRFFSSNPRPNRGSGPTHPPSSFDGGNHDSPPPPPPYSHSSKPQNYSQSAPPSSTSSSSGFWTGAGLGAAAGYAAARAASASSSTSQTNAPRNNENPWFSFLRPSSRGFNRRDRSSSSSYDSFDRDESPSPPRSYRSSNFGSSSNR